MPTALQGALGLKGSEGPPGPPGPAVSQAPALSPFSTPLAEAAAGRVLGRRGFGKAGGLSDRGPWGARRRPTPGVGPTWASRGWMGTVSWTLRPPAGAGHWRPGDPPVCRSGSHPAPPEREGPSQRWDPPMAGRGPGERGDADPLRFTPTEPLLSRGLGRAGGVVRGH